MAEQETLTLEGLLQAVALLRQMTVPPEESVVLLGAHLQAMEALRAQRVPLAPPPAQEEG